MLRSTSSIHGVVRLSAYGGRLGGAEVDGN